MAEKLKVVAVLPAFNAAGTLKSFIEKFPFKVFDEVILVDDGSSDKTFEVAKKIKGIRVFKNSRNLGYGGNLKVCLGIANARGADVVVEIHPDGEYGFEGILPAIEEIKKGAGMVLGDRFSNGVPVGMPIWKVPLTKLLSKMGNLVLGTRITDLHQGFRAYSGEMLGKITYKSASNNYIFSFEVIALAVINGFKISSVPVFSFYKGRKRGASFRASVVYFLGVLGVLGGYGLRKGVFISNKSLVDCSFCGRGYSVRRVLSSNGFDLLWCGECLIGFTNPVPKNLDKYYPENYWSPEGGLGMVKKFVFRIAQARRVKWVKEFLPRGSNVLDVGSGEGEFAEQLKGFKVLSLESANSKVKNPEVVKADFLGFKSKEKFSGVVFWESLEHVAEPLKYLEQIGRLIKPDGIIFIEYPRYNCFESRVFKEKWFHLDMPRHLAHFTERGLIIQAQRKGFKIVKTSGVLALEYSVFGLFSSVMSNFNLPVNRFRHGLIIYLLLSPVIFVSFIFELLLYTINESPIGLLVLKKENELHKKI